MRGLKVDVCSRSHAQLRDWLGNGFVVTLPALALVSEGWIHALALVSEGWISLDWLLDLTGSHWISLNWLLDLIGSHWISLDWLLCLKDGYIISIQPCCTVPKANLQTAQVTSSSICASILRNTVSYHNNRLPLQAACCSTWMRLQGLMRPTCRSVSMCVSMCKCAHACLRVLS